MKISIITVCYNASKTIEDTIFSVLNQDYEKVEYIIIDGASNDGTQDIISKFKDQISIFVSEQDNGIYDGMNKGIALATGDVIGILNADDVYSSSNVLSNISRLFQQSNSAAVYADLEYVT